MPGVVDLGLVGEEGGGGLGGGGGGGRMARSSRIPRGTEGFRAMERMGAGVSWEKRLLVVVVVWERRAAVAAVNHVVVKGEAGGKGWDVKPVSMAADSQWRVWIRLSLVVWKRKEVLSREYLLAATRDWMRAGRFGLSVWEAGSRSCGSSKGGWWRRPQPGGRLAAPRVSRR